MDMRTRYRYPGRSFIQEEVLQTLASLLYEKNRLSQPLIDIEQKIDSQRLKKLSSKLIRVDP